MWLSSSSCDARTLLIVTAGPRTSSTRSTRTFLVWVWSRISCVDWRCCLIYIVMECGCGEEQLNLLITTLNILKIPPLIVIVLAPWNMLVEMACSGGCVREVGSLTCSCNRRRAKNLRKQLIFVVSAWLLSVKTQWVETDTVWIAGYQILKCGCCGRLKWRYLSRPLEDNTLAMWQGKGWGLEEQTQV